MHFLTKKCDEKGFVIILLRNEFAEPAMYTPSITGAAQAVQQVQRPLYRIYHKFRRFWKDFSSSSVKKENLVGF